VPNDANYDPANYGDFNVLNDCYSSASLFAFNQQTNTYTDVTALSADYPVLQTFDSTSGSLDLAATVAQYGYGG
jgi:hypothetical protein